MDPDSIGTDSFARSVQLFPTDHPLRSGDLIGRDGDVAALAADLRAGSHRVLVGADRSGKTSTAAAAVAAMVAEGCAVVAVDLFRLCGPEQLVSALLAGIGRDEESADDVGLAAAVALLDHHARDSGRRLVLYLDGFQEIATTQVFGKVAAVGAELRAALDESDQLVCLFVGGSSTVMRDLFTSKNQPFHRFGTVTSLPAIDEAAWRDALPARFATGGRDLTTAGLERVIELGEGHARSVMLVAQHTYTLSMTTDDRTVRAELVDAGFRSALAGERLLADNRLAHIRALSKHALSTAMRVANGESPYKNLPPAIARQTLRGLETAGVVDHPHSGAYAIADPMLRHHMLAIASSGPGVTVPAALIQHSAVAALLGAVAAAPVEELASDGDGADVASPPPVAAGPNGKGPAAAVVLNGQPSDTVSAIERSEVAVPAAGRATLRSRVVPVPLKTSTATRRRAAPPRRPPIGAAQQPAAGRAATLRHPDASEAEAVGECVARVTEPSRENVPDSDAEVDVDRLVRFIRHSMARNPERYWQLEVEDRPVGGIVLRQPRKLFGRGAPAGLDPIAQAAVLGVSAALTVVGLTLLVVARAWERGAFSGLLFALLVFAMFHVVVMSPRVIARASASWVARRHGGRVFEAMWSEPAMMQCVFRALARRMPGTHITGYAESPERVDAFRSVGFCVRHSHVVAGVLDPDAERPVRPIVEPSPARAEQRSDMLDEPAPTGPAAQHGRHSAAPDARHRQGHKASAKRKRRARAVSRRR